MESTCRLNRQDPGQDYGVDLSSEPAGSRTALWSRQTSDSESAPESLSRCRLCSSPLGKKSSRGECQYTAFLSKSSSLTGDTLDLLRLSDSLEISLSPNDLSRGHDTRHCTVYS